MTTYVLRTLGCKANLADSQRIEVELQAQGARPWNKGDGLPAGLCIINSCTVTDEADRQTRKLAARLSREHPGAAVVVTGCAAEVDPERLTQSKGIRYVIGNRDKPRLVKLIFEQMEMEQLALTRQGPEVSVVLGQTQGYLEMASRHPIEREWPGAGEILGDSEAIPFRGATATTRQFLKIQEGCNSFCTYCVIPYGRGPSRSLEPDAVIARIRTAVSAGVREIVFTGTNIGDYGTDWSGEPRLEQLMERVLGETGLERLRVSSLDPTEITSGLISLMCRDSRFCPHFHVSLQSASDRVLRLMKRRYGVADILRCFERISRVPGDVGGVFIGMDVITGFPGETGDEFEKGFALLETLPWTRLHVFPFSERSGTPATRLPEGVPASIRQERARRLNALSCGRFLGHHQAVLEKCREGGLLLEGVLLEKGPSRGSEAFYAGYTRNYLRVVLPASSAPGLRENTTVSVRPLGLREERLGGGEAFFMAELPARN